MKNLKQLQKLQTVQLDDGSPNLYIKKNGCFKVVSPNLVGGWTTHLKNMSQIGSFLQVGVNIKTVWNHRLV